MSLFYPPFASASEFPQLPGRTPFQAHSNSPTSPTFNIFSTTRRRRPASMHPALTAYHPAISYKLRKHPSTSLVISTHTPLTSNQLAESAVDPPAPYMTVVCPNLPPTWQITVRPVANGAYVTISDVLEAIYISLRTQVVPEEYYSVRPDVLARINAAFHYRWSSLHSSHKQREERMKGVKRVDFLMEAVTFAGLSAGSEPGVYSLMVT